MESFKLVSMEDLYQSGKIPFEKKPSHGGDATPMLFIIPEIVKGGPLECQS